MTVIPRPASTVVLMDEQARVYMTKRPKTMKFFGGYYVFPGGAVEVDDYVQDDDIFIDKKDSEEIAQAYFVAAARELFEEVGVLLCKTKGGTEATFDEERAAEYRRQLINENLTFIQMLKKEHLTFHSESLIPFGHLITPEQSPIRFDTRFFLAYLPKGQAPKPDEYEVGEAHWLTPIAALEACQNKKISLAPPTILALKTVCDFLNGGFLAMPELQGEDLFNYKLILKKE